MLFCLLRTPLTGEPASSTLRLTLLEFFSFSHSICYFFLWLFPLCNLHKLSFSLSFLWVVSLFFSLSLSQQLLYILMLSKNLIDAKFMPISTIDLLELAKFIGRGQLLLYFFLELELCSEILQLFKFYNRINFFACSHLGDCIVIVVVAIEALQRCKDNFVSFKLLFRHFPMCRIFLKQLVTHNTTASINVSNLVDFW